MANGEKTTAVLARLREPSTWAGLAALLGLLGVNIEAIGAIGQIGSGLAALGAVFLSERGGGA